MKKDICLVVGIPFSGVDEVCRNYADDNYYYASPYSSLSDLKDLTGRYSRMVINGENLDRNKRERVVEIIKSAGGKIRCVYVDTPLEEVYLRICDYMVNSFGRLLEPDEIDDVSYLYRADEIKDMYDNFEIPSTEEGFDDIEEEPVVSMLDVYNGLYNNKALFLDYDSTLRESEGPECFPYKTSHVRILPNRSQVLEYYNLMGYILVGVSNQSAIAKGYDEKDIIKCFKYTNKKLNKNIDFSYCRHGSEEPIRCYCRKPMPGMGVHFIHKYRLNPSRCIMVGDMDTDKQFAESLGMEFYWPDEFFSQTV